MKRLWVLSINYINLFKIVAMRVLLSNDDGYQSPGLQCLIDHLAKKKNTELVTDVAIVAPDRDRSGASNSLTLDRPLRPTKYQAHEQLQESYYLAGTPTDCVHIAVTALLDKAPDIVVSGINIGANLGDDVLYSGTVAAATEGRFLGLPAIAVSLVLTGSKAYYDTAAKIVLEILTELENYPLPADRILNINVPNLPYEQIKGVQSTRLGKRHKAQPAIPATDPRNNKVYWLGPVGNTADAGPGSDFYAVEHGYVSITPLTIDLTDHNLIAPLNDWLNSGLNNRS